jgi:chromosomal replication initiator protein
MKSRLKGYEVPEDVISFLAENIETNIRELEGAITKIIGFATLMNRPLNIETACEAMKDVIKKNPRIVSIDHIVKTITEKFGIKLSDLQSKKRNKSVALPRQIAMFLIKKTTSHSLQDIGAYFGGRDHTTVLYAHKRIGDRVKNDENFRSLVNDLTQRITDG